LIRDLVEGGRLSTEVEVIEEAFRLLEDRHLPRRIALELTVFDVLDQAGLIGCLEGSPDTPDDLSTNPAHMEGFGRD